MRKSVVTLSSIFAGMLVFTQVMSAQSEAQDRLNRAADVLSQMTSAIPQQELARAQCIVVIPGLKSGAFLVGAEHGKGFASCRTASGWTAPAPYTASGGSIGLQAGGKEQDLVLLLMTQNAHTQLVQNNLKMGATASAEAGSTTAAPKETTADILAYSHSSGLFAGASVNGVSLHPDDDTIHALYGPNMTDPQILAGQAPAPPAAQRFQSVLAQAAGGR